jgi:pimeloyl-ACP methyl ester carboxylesterase
MPFADSEGIRIYYDDRGEGEPALLCLPGWCNTHTIFTPLAEHLSADHRVLVMDWRGHGNSQASDRDFGFPEMAGDAVAVMQDSGAQSVIPIAQGQAPWAAVELHRLLSERMPKMVASSWPVISPSANPLASRFLNAIRALGYYERWREGAEQLLRMWLSGAPPSVETQIRNQMLRRLLVGSAHYILGPFGGDSDVRRHGQKIASRGGKNAKKRAAVAVARKLAVLLHRLWVTGEVYDPLYNANRSQEREEAA